MQKKKINGRTKTKELFQFTDSLWQIRPLRLNDDRNKDRILKETSIIFWELKYNP